VRTTAEVVLAANDRLLFARNHDPATGYDKLVIREREPLRPATATRSSQPGVPSSSGNNRLVRHAPENRRLD